MRSLDFIGIFTITIISLVKSRNSATCAKCLLKNTVSLCFGGFVLMFRWFRFGVSGFSTCPVEASL